MNMLITPHPLAGRIDPVMSSKSQAHRLLICAALADGPTELRNVGFSADVEATLRCLRALGTKIETDADTLRIVPVAHIQKGALLDCGESGSTLRFLLPVSASLGAECAFTGQGKLSQRPLSPLYEEMQA
ncbi:MAG: 3-phosphoshikimate 1-carboxyvinyltransferase, partial [Clostridia bacterium]|nr:3-phosphoshikimate 1-carboxyvinyltransferase [Clostridia bacterium]